jgi:hypothetical protein
VPSDFVGVAGLNREKLECENRGVVGQLFGDDLHIFRRFWLTSCSESIEFEVARDVVVT